MRSFALQIWNYFLDAFFPKKCLVCFEEGSWLCPKHKHFPEPSVLGTKKISKIWIYSRYSYPSTKKIIHYLKFKNFKSLSDLCAQMMYEKLPKDFWKDQTIIPIPLHPSRKLERGFNQSEYLAWSLKRLDPSIQINTVGLKRVKKTKQQLKLKKSERTKNLKDAFAWEKQPLPKNIILLDDVFTTGTTLDSAAEAIKKAGPANIQALVFAHE